MKLTITIHMDSAAFEYGRDQELEKTFLEIRELIALGTVPGRSLLDSNGNKIGSWSLKGKRDD